MGRLRQYFESAETTAPADRQVGLEVETLFVDAHGQPVDEVQVRAIFEGLAGNGWTTADASRPEWEMQRDGFRLVPEVGAGNLEIITPPRAVGAVDDLLEETVERLDELYRVAARHGAEPVYDSYDGFQHVDNLLLPDARDRKWAAVDGRKTLKYLAHIASVHATVDLASIEEGFELIAAAGDFIRDRGWPVGESVRIWRDYLRDSHVDYDPRRFGEAPETFEAYLDLLRSFVVVMDVGDRGDLQRLTPDPPRLADVEQTVDLGMFLGTVWFYTRLRVVEGRLALEIRALPRSTDEAMVEDVSSLLEALPIA